MIEIYTQSFTIINYWYFIYTLLIKVGFTYPLKYLLGKVIIYF
jgi:hypothetical protein